MYLHLGQDMLVKTDEVIGLFDLDTTSVSVRTRQYLAAAEKAKQVVNVSDELPKSFIVAAARRSKKSTAKQVLYINQIGTKTLKKRLETQQQSPFGVAD